MWPWEVVRWLRLIHYLSLSKGKGGLGFLGREGFTGRRENVWYLGLSGYAGKSLSGNKLSLGVVLFLAWTYLYKWKFPWQV